MARTNDTDFYFKLPSKLKARMERAAERARVSASEYVRQAITEKLRRR
jgi:Arc/MetJ-type ribon-helix-helix transcriptional regulator